MTFSLPFSIWALSLSSFFLNFSSVIVFGLTSIVMRECGVKADDIACFEGLIEGMALVIRAIVGWVSDLIGRRKGFLLWGYGISAIGRVLFTFTPYFSSALNFFAPSGRFIDKIGNGLQASPREALISDVAPADKIGQAYGLNKALSMAGSFAGSAVFLMLFLSNNTNKKDIFLLLKIATLFSILSFLCLKFLVKEKTGDDSATTAGHRSSKALIKRNDPENVKEASPQKKVLWHKEFQRILTHLKEFKGNFWTTIFIIFVFKLGYFSGVVIMDLLAQRPGITFFDYGLYQNKFGANAVFLVIQNLTCCLLAYPLGRLSDFLDRRWVVGMGFFFMITSLLIFSCASSSLNLYMAIAIYGLQMSIQGALLALLNTTMPVHLHGTGFGLFFFISGISVMLSNLLLPRIKDMVSLEFGFMVIGVFISIACWFIPSISESPRKLQEKRDKKVKDLPPKEVEVNVPFLWSCRILSLFGIILCSYVGVRCLP